MGRVKKTMKMERVTTIMSYFDKTWCMARCKPLRFCGRQLSDWDIAVAAKHKIPIAYSDFSPGCELYVPDEEGSADVKED